MTRDSTLPAGHHGELNRGIGFWGLTFIALGSIIGSGWLLGALTRLAGRRGASLISWVLAAFMLSVLALIHAELGTAYPVAGGTARFPYFAFGALAGFTAGWAAYLQAVTIAPIEVEASIQYVDGTDWAQQHFKLLNANDHTLNARGFIVAVIAMLLFTAINLAGVKLLSDSNFVIVIWKIAMPVLTIVVLIFLAFHIHNFTAGGGFSRRAAHGIFAALPWGWSSPCRASSRPCRWPGRPATRSGSCLAPSSPRCWSAPRSTSCSRSRSSER